MKRKSGDDASFLLGLVLGIAIGVAVQFILIPQLQAGEDTQMDESVREAAEQLESKADLTKARVLGAAESAE